MGGAIGGLVAGGGSLLGGIFGSHAASKASNQAVSALQQALGFQQGVYGTAQGNLQPYIGAGQSALASLLGAYGLPGGTAGGPTAAFSAFQQTPGYQFPLQQGNLALQRQLASMGLTNSGAALKDASAYNSGYASQNYQNFLSGLSGLATGGQQAAGTLGQIGTNIGGLNLQGQTGIGGALAGGTVGANNALNGGLAGLIGSLTTSPGSATSNSPLSNAYNWLSNQFGTSSYGSPASGTPALPVGGAYPTGGVV